MRVVAGQARGRRLQTPRGLGVRPTSERVRQALMDILAPWTQGRRWLDLYAGSGAVGIEALSRGAGQVVFVERHRLACRTILANLQQTGLQDRAELRCQEVRSALAQLAQEGRRFDVIFADPPYQPHGAPLEELEILLVRLLAPGGLVAVEHSARHRPPRWASLRRVREARYGETQISFYIADTEPSPWQ